MIKIEMGDQLEKSLSDTVLSVDCLLVQRLIEFQGVGEMIKRF